MACLPALVGGGAHLCPRRRVRLLPHAPHLEHIVKGKSAAARIIACPAAACAAASSAMFLPVHRW